MIDTVNYNFDGSLLDRSFIERYCSTVFPTRKTLRQLYGLFLELTRQLYSAKNNLLFDCNAVWNSDPKLSKIWIDTEYIWEDKTPEFRPAIYISINGLNLQPLVSPKGEIGGNLQEGEKYYGREIKGAVTFVHIGQTKGETINLMDNTYSFFDGLSDVIRQDFCFDKFNVVNINPLRVVKAEKDHLRGEIIASFSYTDTWSVKLESPKLKKLILSTGQEVLNMVN